ncbi:MAG: glycosyltransferase [Acidimicrobiia bacterium]|nr:glycosyltransferase [Acidimicrobiia bacterium]
MIESRRARLAVVVSSDRRRGAEVFGEALAAGLGQRGWDVRLFALSEGDRRSPRIDAEPMAAVAADTLGKLDRTVVTALRRRLRTWEPAIVLAYGGPSVQYSTVAVRSLWRRPRLVVVSIGDPMFWIRSRRHARLRSLLYAGADRVLSVAAATTTPLMESLGVAPAKIRVAATGVPDRFFDIERDPRGTALRIVVIGALSAEKDPLAAIEVVATVAATTPVELRILGSGPLSGEVAAAVRAGGLGDRVELCGSVEDIAPHLAWADVLLQTSKSEGLPGVVLEAGAAGVPSVVFDVGGCAEAVVDEETGVVVAAGDGVGAAAALVDLAAHRDRLTAMGQAARRHMAASYPLATAIDRYHQLLLDELEAARRQPAVTR